MARSLPLLSLTLILTGVGPGIGFRSLAGAQTPARASSPAPEVETPGLKATQVTVVIERNSRQRRFRANILTRKNDDLTLLTAAHCLSDEDQGGSAYLLVEGEIVEGSVVSVVRNPAYRARLNREIPGADNAVARLRMKRPGNPPALKAYESLRPVQGLTARPFPGPDGQTISVRLIDARGVEHVLKAGNHRNPRYLEWGPAYRPIPGDSGGGVFVVRDGPGDEPPLAILIGTIVASDERGGVASLVSREMRWIADEMTR